MRQPTQRAPVPPGRRPVVALGVVVLVALTTSACSSAPLAPLPVPLPEVDAWPAAPQRGAFLGLHTEENDSRSLDALFFEPGVRVARVVENSPAEGAGLTAGDVVLEIDGHPLTDPAELEARVAERAADTTVALTVRRGDAVFDVPVRLVSSGDRPRGADVGAPLWLLDPARSRAGWNDAGGGVRLVSASPGSPVIAAGLPLGAVVTAIDGESVRSARALVRRLQARDPGADVTLTWRHAGAETVTELALADSPRRVTEFDVPILWSYSADPDGDAARLDIIDLWLFSLFSYERVGGERTWTLLEFFEFSSGTGQLAE